MIRQNGKKIKTTFEKKADEKYDSGYAPRDDVGEGLGIDADTKKRAKERIMGRAGLEPVENLTKKMDTLYDKLQKKGMSSDQIMATPDMKRLVEKRTAARQQEKSFDEVIDKSISAKEKEATVEPLQTRTPPRTYIVKKNESMSDIANKYNVDLNTLFSLNRMATTDKITPGQKLTIPTRFKDEISNEAKAQRAITELEARRKKFQEKHGNKSPEQKIAEVYKLMKSTDDKFIEQTKDIYDKLESEKGRVTAEEFIAELVRSYGLDDLADSFEEARAQLSDQSDLGSVEQAYYAAEDSIESVIEKLDLVETDIKGKIQGAELDLKVASGSSANVNTRLKTSEKEETTKDGKKYTKKQTAEYLDDDQKKAVAGTIQKIVNQKNFDMGKLGE